MQQLIKHLKSSTCFFYLLLLLLVFNCQKDDTVNDSIEQQNQLRKPPNFTANIFNGDSILNTNPNLKSKLQRFNNKVALRTMQSSNHDFSIDTTRVLKIQTSSYISYTFIVERSYPVDDVLENYIITHFNNDTYKQYFISYPIINNNGEISYDMSNAQINILNDDSLVYSRETNCVSVMVFEDPVCIDMPCQGAQKHTIEQGNECPYWGTTNMATRECTEGGWIDPGCSTGGSVGNDNPSGNTDPGGNTIGGSGTVGPGGTIEPEPEDEIVIILAPTLIQQIENCINRPTMIGVPDSTTITPGLIAGLNLSIPQLLALNNYLRVQNQCSEEAQAEIIAMIELINGMDKECQAFELAYSVLKINSTFTNKIKNYFITSSDNNLNFQDLDTGESVSDEPPMPASVGARVLPEPGSDGTIILQFNNDHLDSATSLGYVNTFYHELLHAYILRLYFTGELLTEYPEYSELKTAMDNFFNNSSNITLGEIYDEKMHDIYIDFIDQIAESIVAYCDYNNINGVDLVYAKKLVWGGLNGYDVFNDNLTPTQRLEAQTLLAHENFNNTSNAKGTKTCN